METIWKRKQTNKQTSRGGTCGGADAGGSAELHSMQSLICNASEYVEELWRCFGDASEKHRVQYAGLYSDIITQKPIHLKFDMPYRLVHEISLQLRVGVSLLVRFWNWLTVIERYGKTGKW